MSSADMVGSLAGQFEAPKGYRGVFGWMCGYSADKDFLNIAAERFTGMIETQRVSDGGICLALMLDRHNSQITPVEVPGVSHLSPKESKQPFHLMHAKVALLGYEKATGGWMLRLLVSTGNWTRQTMEDSLDLVWRVDLDAQDLTADEDEPLQAASDIAAAWDLLHWLSGSYDTRMLQKPEVKGTHLAKEKFESWIEAVEARVTPGQTAPRFMDNRKESFVSRLPTMVGQNSARRNYLAMGSGFFQGEAVAGKIPSVIETILGTLKSLLTARPEVDVFVNPDACQAVAESVDALKDLDYTVRPARDPAPSAGSNRSLHAKFLFSANCRSNSIWCLNPWVYLGSGNLTERGFMKKASSSGGNLEAGVVFAPEAMVWNTKKKPPDGVAVTEVLPIQWEEESSSLESGPREGLEASEDLAGYFPPPVPCLSWREGPDRNLLEPLPDLEQKPPFEVLDESGTPCLQLGEAFVWTGPCRPRLVCLHWKNLNGEWVKGQVPVLDEYGRLAAAPLPKWDVEEAWGQLAGFPLPPPPEDGPGDTDHPDTPVEDEKGVDVPPEGGNIPAGNTPSARYPIRTAMELIENIAAKQTALREQNWPAWCIRLEQCLSQAAESHVADSFKTKLKLNLFKPLWDNAFRPDYAVNRETEPGALYEETLEKITRKWGLDNLPGLGDVQ